MPGATTAGIRVLIVDDHALFRRGLREHLEASGLNVVGEAEDAAGAVALFTETEPEVILMDLHMPGDSSLDAIRGMRLAVPDARILMMTVSTEEEKVMEAIIAGACGYLLKDSDGDQIVAICALALGVDLVAVTVMTNLGFHRLMEERGIRVVTTDVGDRYVLDALRREGGMLGGEQSGHLIVLDGHVSGDGIAAALTLCRSLAGRPLAEAAAVMPRFPQAKENVVVPSLEIGPAVADEVGRLNAELSGRGRVLVRPSGTEPVVRVLAEAESAEEAEGLCGSIADLVRREAGAVKALQR